MQQKFNQTRSSAYEVDPPQASRPSRCLLVLLGSKSTSAL